MRQYLTKTMSKSPPLVPVVYTMGKVDSSSTSKAIQAAGLNCLDIHNMNHEKILGVAQDWINKGKFPPPNICVSMAHRERLLVKKNKCLYVSLVRDPIARNLSAFFQNLHQMDDEIRDETDPDKLAAYFIKAYQHNLPLQWFDREYKTELGIDVFSWPFERAQKYTWNKSANTILFRIDCPDEVKSQVLSDALGRQITVGRLNVGANKGYNTIYGKIKDLVSFPADFLDRMYDSKFVRHFWLPDEIDEMKNNWIGK